MHTVVMVVMVVSLFWNSPVEMVAVGSRVALHKWTLSHIVRCSFACVAWCCSQVAPIAICDSNDDTEKLANWKRCYCWIRSEGPELSLLYNRNKLPMLPTTAARSLTHGAESFLWSHTRTSSIFWTRKFITVFTRALYWSLSWAKSIHSILSHCLYDAF
jgi:hypothetical protein